MNPEKIETTQSSLLIPEKFLDVFFEKTEEISREEYFHRLLSNSSVRNSSTMEFHPTLRRLWWGDTLQGGKQIARIGIYDINRDHRKQNL